MSIPPCSPRFLTPIALLLSAVAWPGCATEVAPVAEASPPDEVVEPMDPVQDHELGVASDEIRSSRGSTPSGACLDDSQCGGGARCVQGGCLSVLPIFTRVHAEEAVGVLPLETMMDYLADVNHQWTSSAAVCFAFQVTGWDPSETDPTSNGHPQPELGAEGFDLRFEASPRIYGLVHWEFILGYAEPRVCQGFGALGPRCLEDCLANPDMHDACEGGTVHIRTVDFLVGGAQVHGPAAKYNVSSTMAHELGHLLLRRDVWHAAGLAAGAAISPDPGTSEHSDPENVSVGSFGYALDPWELPLARQSAEAYAMPSLPCYPMPGDLNFDGRIDAADVAMLDAAIAVGSHNIRYDLDRDGAKVGRPGGPSIGADRAGPPFRPGQGFFGDVDADDRAWLLAHLTD